MNITNSNGVELAYDRFGNPDDPSILLIAGLGTQMIRWTPSFCEGLTGLGYHVVRFDNRDAGKSTHFGRYGTPDFAALSLALMAGEKPDVPYTLYDMAADAISLLDALEIERAHLVGRSMGGMIAQIMASTYPARTRSLVSIMSTTGNPALPPPLPDAMELMMRPTPDFDSDPAAFLANRLAFHRRIAGTGYPFDTETARDLIVAETRRASNRGGTARQIAAIAVTGDRRPQLAAITVPTLVIHGSDDPLFLPACGQDTAAAIPNAELMLIEGMGHDLPSALIPNLISAIDGNASRARS
jgi:pimeloyl-ACP methyl ester carboxylesterase